jgi:hypothetical protein
MWLPTPPSVVKLPFTNDSRPLIEMRLQELMQLTDAVGGEAPAFVSPPGGRVALCKCEGRVVCHA